MTGADPAARAGGRLAPAPPKPVPPKPPPPKRWWLAPLKLALTAAATWLILRGAGIRLADAWRIDWTLTAPRAPFLALSVALLFATFAMSAALWRRILALFGGERVPLAESAAILLVANLGRYVPGKILQLVGVAVLARRRGLSGVKAAAAAVAAQMLNLAGAAAVGVWVAAWAAGALETRGVSAWPAVAAGAAVAAGLAAFLCFGGAGAALRWALRRSGSAAADLPSPSGKSLLLLLPGYAATWIVCGAALACLARGVGIDIGLGAAATAFAAAYFAGYAAIFAPAGIGVRESTLAVLLAPAVGAEAGVLLAALQRVWITAAELAGAAFGAFALRRPAAGRGAP